MRRPSVGVLILVLVALTLAGCGGGSGGGTSSPSATVSVVDGVTGAVLADAAVTARPGDAVTVERAGYLRRDTIVARDGILSLWPVTVDETYVRTLVYSEARARNRLSRWPGTTVPVARDFPADVVELVRPWVALVPSDSPAITITIDPGDAGFAQFPPETIAYAFRQISDTDARILSVQLFFKSEGDLRRPGSLAHEVGHALGLEHSSRQQDLMFPSTARTSLVFSPDERVLLTMMYAHRRPGQVAPDNDQALGPSSTGVIRSLLP
jgi:hypothetical protein